MVVNYFKISLASEMHLSYTQSVCAFLKVDVMPIEHVNRAEFRKIFYTVIGVTVIIPSVLFTAGKLTDSAG